ncbi:hypothetical protein KVR01_000915 [Diaporthe batatas]|uniref:uncharacterized protein n=1 Tax=Diaporthe batatas TaxID=748121 RepID=UPI001D049B65|nr:uncharacterized protein KVR01_000915 [Diaporthe batatas]KAG8170170.1 hypothetical protein KVR01_000915 [Diaporthe batatas]
MFKVVIIGAGLGGLACAVACRRYGLEVVVLEQAPRITPIGAGIQAPPNASRALKWLGLLEQVQAKACLPDSFDLLRYEDGSCIIRRDIRDSEQRYRAPWIVIHRADYHKALLDAAVSAGAEIRLGSIVTNIDFEDTTVEVRGGQVISADVIVGADGLWSTARDRILGHPSPPRETGDLAYRATLKTSDLLALDDARVTDLCKQQHCTVWVGPNKHCVFYPVKGGSEYNLVLIRPDDLPPGTNKVQGEIGEMRENFKGWDSSLTKIISRIPAGNVTVLGDACHPTLPYQAQGAAMAVEDGAVLGNLIGSLVRDEKELPGPAHEHVGSLLQVYEKLRKLRTTTNAKGAEANQYMFHLEDGEEQRRRDTELKAHDWIRPSRWRWADPSAQDELLGHDVIAESEMAYKEWKSSKIHKI